MHSPLHYEEVTIGETWDSPARTVTETDVVNFAGVSGDFNPLHVDHEFARGTPFGRPIAHGLLGLALVAGLGSFSPWMKTTAFLGITEWRFLKPLFIGDTVRVHTEILGKQPKGRRHGIVSWRRQLINQAGDIVQEGHFETLVALATPGQALRVHAPSLEPQPLPKAA
jgi:acyl dehydratase